MRGHNINMDVSNIEASSGTRDSTEQQMHP